VAWNKGEPEGLKDKELIAINGFEVEFMIGRYSAKSNWINMFDSDHGGNSGIWKMYNIAYWIRLEEPPEIELDANGMLTDWL
jgi:hypothetical protein